MGRLVDIEDVKDFINGLDSLPWEEEVDDLVKTIPTAYDVEKVVADLEEATKFVDLSNPTSPISHKVSAIHPSVAISIVKRGGVE